MEQFILEIISGVVHTSFTLYFVSAFAITFLVQHLGYTYADLSPVLEPIVASRLDILPHYVFNYLRASDIYVATYHEGTLVDIKRFILDPSLVHPETAKYWRSAITYRPPSREDGVHIFDLDYPNKKHLRFFARIPDKSDVCPFELDPMNTPIPKELLPPEWQVEPLTRLGEPRPPSLVYPGDVVYRSYIGGKPWWEYKTPPTPPAPYVPTGPDEVD